MALLHFKEGVSELGSDGAAELCWLNDVRWGSDFENNMHALKNWRGTAEELERHS